MTVRILFLRVILALNIGLLQETLAGRAADFVGALAEVVDHSRVHRDKWDGFLVVDWIAVKIRMKPYEQWRGLEGELMEVEEYQVLL